MLEIRGYRHKKPLWSYHETQLKMKTMDMKKKERLSSKEKKIGREKRKEQDTTVEN